MHRCPVAFARFLAGFIGLEPDRGQALACSFASLKVEFIGLKSTVCSALLVSRRDWAVVKPFSMAETRLTPDNYRHELQIASIPAHRSIADGTSRNNHDRAVGHAK